MRHLPVVAFLVLAMVCVVMVAAYGSTYALVMGIVAVIAAFIFQVCEL